MVIEGTYCIIKFSQQTPQYCSPGSRVSNWTQQQISLHCGQMQSRHGLLFDTPNTSSISSSMMTSSNIELYAVCTPSFISMSAHHLLFKFSSSFIRSQSSPLVLYTNWVRGSTSTSRSISEAENQGTSSSAPKIAPKMTQRASHGEPEFSLVSQL